MADQLITVKLQRGDNTPWGFRLSGGKDFGFPLAVQRVNPGSLAENGGLQPGDGILKIQGHPTENLRHKEAQDTIVKSGNFLELVVQRGGATIWKPKVTPVGNLPSPSLNAGEPTLMTKTSLAANKPEFTPIGSGHNVVAKPFGGAGTVPAVVHNQYNSPAALYSLNNIAETLSAHTEVLTTGAVGINFMKEDKPLNKDSAVYKMVLEEDKNAPKECGGPNSPSIQSPGVAPAPPAPPAPAPKPVSAPVAPAPPAGTPGPGQNTCAECGRLIVGVFVRIKDRSLHAECFRCSTCGTSLKNVGYYNINEKLYCDIHAKQAARMIAPQADVIACSPGAPIPSNFGIVGASQPPPLAPLVTTAPQFPPVPAVGTPGTPGSTGFVNVSPIPFHRSESRPEAHNAATTPVSSFKPPSTQTPKPAPSFGAPLSTPFHPTTAPAADAHRQAPGGTRFTWPPPKPSPQSPLPAVPIESNATPAIPTYRPPPGTQHVQFSPGSTTPKSQPAPPFSASSSSVPSFPPAPLPGSSLSPGKIPPPTAPKPAAPLAPAPALASARVPPPPAPKPSVGGGGPFGGGPSPVSTTSGQSHGAGSRPAPKRGRGQLKPQAAPGTRIPICASCGSPIRGPFVVALGKTWCPEHFLCANGNCRRSLQDIGFVEEQGQLYCEVCYETYLAPVCSKCGARIKGDCLNALDKQWHPECFICTYCKQPFGNSSFYLEDGMPYCEKDWNELFTTKCVGCGFPIEAGDRWVEALNNNYHSQCFKCTICHKNLEGQSFYAKGGRPFCKAHAR